MRNYWGSKVVRGILSVILVVEAASSFYGCKSNESTVKQLTTEEKAADFE